MMKHIGLSAAIAALAACVVAMPAQASDQTGVTSQPNHTFERKAPDLMEHHGRKRRSSRRRRKGHT